MITRSEVENRSDDQELVLKTITITLAQKKALKKIAKNLDMSVSGVIRMVINDLIKKEGLE
jgi:hypothetical protein